MSQLFVDNIKNRTGGAIGAPSGAVVTGVATATQFSGDIVGVAATFSGDVIVGGTLSYEDVTNIDSTGIITAKSGIEFGVSGVGGTITATGQAQFAGVCTATSFVGSGSGLTGVAATDNINTSTLAQFTGGVGIADSIFHIGDDNTAIRFPAADTFSVETAGNEAFRITSRSDFLFSNGFMNETVNINTTARTGTQAVNLDEGMVHYFSTNSSATWKPNFTMSSGDDINATIAIGDVFSPTMIVAKGATTHFANAIQVDGIDVTPEFLGGAPTDGGASGTFDVYSYTIIKTGDDTFKAFASVSTYE